MKFEEAFMWSLNYDGWEMHIDAMYEYVNDPANRDVYGHVPFPREASRCVTRDDVNEDRPNSILWMCLVMMFGNYGTSPRFGWIEHPDDAAAWLQEMRRYTYRCSTYATSDDWVETDEDLRKAVAKWERTGGE